MRCNFHSVLCLNITSIGILDKCISNSNLPQILSHLVLVVVIHRIYLGMVFYTFIWMCFILFFFLSPTIMIKYGFHENRIFINHCSFPVYCLAHNSCSKNTLKKFIFAYWLSKKAKSLEGLLNRELSEYWVREYTD